jgi:hypothetical protein
VSPNWYQWHRPKPPILVIFFTAPDPPFSSFVVALEP